MKIKLLAASILFLALGMSTTEAQNKQKSGFEKERTHRGNQGDGFSKKEGKFEKDGGRFKQDRKHRKDFRHHRKQHKRGSFNKKHNRNHTN